MPFRAIENYDLENGTALETIYDEDNLPIGDNRYVGVNLKGVHYVIDWDDHYNDDEDSEGLVIPRQVWRVVSHNQEEARVVVTEVRERSLLRRINEEYRVANVEKNPEISFD
ncbi:MAG: hypothetical protein CMH64_02215 [Nanoarchaeota archaeon]|nr:hypothetical protein [Nanoarchaeota archaeon]|tara:strand:+ start:751 stop:1086 length:336 start_codon:yes stop_codon:yes gene_type:complete